MCSPAPVVGRYGKDVAIVFGIPTTYNQPGSGGTFLGSVGDQDHATRKSSHNCAPMQESAVNGVGYHPDYAHAWDARPADMTTGMSLVQATLPDDRVRYINFADIRYYPDGRRESTDHPTFHVSFLPGTHNDTRPFFNDQGDDFTMADIDALVNATDRQTEVIRNQGRKGRANDSRIAALARRQNARLDKDDGAVLKAQEDIEAADAVLAEDD